MRQIKQIVLEGESRTLNVKTAFPILSGLKTLYPEISYLEMFKNFSAISAMSPVMRRVSRT